MRIDWVKLMEPYDLDEDQIDKISHWAAAYIENEKIMAKHGLSSNAELKTDLMWNILKTFGLIKVYEFKKEAFFLAIGALECITSSIKELKGLVKEGVSEEELQEKINSMNLDTYAI